MCDHECARFWVHCERFTLVRLDVRGRIEEQALQGAIAKAHANANAAEPSNQTSTGSARKQYDAVEPSGFELLGHAPHSCETGMLPFALFAPPGAMVVINHLLHPHLFSDEGFRQGRGLGYDRDSTAPAAFCDHPEVVYMPDQITDARVLKQQHRSWPLVVVETHFRFGRQSNPYFALPAQLGPRLANDFSEFDKTIAGQPYPPAT